MLATGVGEAGAAAATVVVVVVSVVSPATSIVDRQSQAKTGLDSSKAGASESTSSLDISLVWREHRYELTVLRI